MGSRKNLKQKKNKRSRKVFSIMKEVYSKTEHMGKRGRFRKYKGSGGGI